MAYIYTYIHTYIQIVATWLRGLPKKQEAKKDPFSMSTLNNSVEMLSDSLVYQDSKNADRDQDYEDGFEEYEEEVCMYCMCACMYVCMYGLYSKNLPLYVCMFLCMYACVQGIKYRYVCMYLSIKMNG